MVCLCVCVFDALFVVIADVSSLLFLVVVLLLSLHCYCPAVFLAVVLLLLLPCCVAIGAVCALLCMPCSIAAVYALLCCHCSSFPHSLTELP